MTALRLGVVSAKASRTVCRRLSLLIMISLLVVQLVSTASASPINIDTFDYGAMTASIIGRDVWSGQATIADTSQTIGGKRWVYMSTTHNPISAMGMADLLVTGGEIALGTNSAISPYTCEWVLTYYGGGDLVNDDGTPNTGILFDFASADHGYSLRVDLRDGASELAYLSRTLPANPGSHEVFFPFSDFHGATGFYFTGVSEINVTIRGAEDGDYDLENITASVPEPGTLGLLGLGLAALVVRRPKCLTGAAGDMVSPTRLGSDVSVSGRDVRR